MEGLRVMEIGEKGATRGEMEPGGGRQHPGTKTVRQSLWEHAQRVEELGTLTGTAQRRPHQAVNKGCFMAHVTFAK